jgi:predicted nuclease of restriction endonuclease-like (RecB) superfamily
MESKNQPDRKSFAALLADVKLRIQTAQTRAMLAVNSELIRLYWDIGRMIDARQKLEGWGAGVIPQLAAELKNEMPELKGFSERNIGRMIAFHREYPNPAAILPQPVAKLDADAALKSQHVDNQLDIISPQAVAKLAQDSILQQPVAKLGAGSTLKPQQVDNQSDTILQQPVAKLGTDTTLKSQQVDNQSDTILPQAAAKLGKAEIEQDAAAQFDNTPFWNIPWAHHVILMQKVKDLAVRCWYMEQTLANGWSRNVLAMQIDAQAHARHGKVLSNFAMTLPEHQSDLVQQTLKDPYIFDFLTLTEPFQERELENEMVRQLEKFLLELGQGFAFVGRQYKIEVGDEDFYIDLLFYHLRLRAFIVIELKKGKFKPEYAGKLNFYCNVVNDRLKQATDNPTIGLILCQERSQLLAEYSFAGIDKPIGISTYELTRALPKSMKSALPTVEEIEAELNEVAKQAKAKRTRGKRGGTVRETAVRYGTASIHIVNQPFDTTNIINLTPAHLAAIKSGQTLALDVQNKYVLFLQSDSTSAKQP